MQVTGILIGGFFTYLLATRILFPALGWYGVALILPAAAFVAYAVSPYVRKHWRLLLFAVVMMTAFNFFSHGTQDIYPTFLQKQHGFGTATVSIIAIFYNIAAIIGGIAFGSLSQRIGRRRASIIAALLGVPVAFLWAFSGTAVLLALGAILMQISVQGAWGVVPAHLNELSPPDSRGTFPGTVYQLGNLIASVNAVLQTGVAERTGGNYAIALAAVAIAAALVISICMKFGPEARDVEMT
jgi:SHS family lactate transporter-like MFS transporter